MDYKKYLQKCPRCGLHYFTPYSAPKLPREVFEMYPPPSLSKVDNRTYICSSCGELEDAMGLTRVVGDERKPI